MEKSSVFIHRNFNVKSKIGLGNTFVRIERERRQVADRQDAIGVFYDTRLRCEISEDCQSLFSTSRSPC